MISLSNILRWWRQELLNLVPNWCAIAFLGGTSARVLKFDPKVEKISSSGKGTMAPIRLLRDGEPITPRTKRRHIVDVMLPDDLVLRRVIKAPKQARSKLHSLAALDLKRNTPFSDKTAVWALGRTNVQDKTLHITQYVSKSADLKALRRRLDEAGLSVRRFVSRETDGASIVLQDFTSTNSRHTRKWQLLNLFLLTASLGMALFWFLEPAIEARAKFRTLTPQLSTLRIETVDLRQRVDAVSAQRNEEDRLRTTLQLRPRLIEVIRSVTVALPDEAWVSTLSFTPNAMTLIGETSAAAVDIVLGLSRNRQFGNPRLSGPTTRTRDGREKFEIAATPGAQE